MSKLNAIDYSSDKTGQTGKLAVIALSLIHDTFDVRDRKVAAKDTAGIGELAESIQSAGLLQPIVVFPQKGRYELIDGRRRYQACKSLDMESVPVLITSFASKAEYYAAALEANVTSKAMRRSEKLDTLSKLKAEGFADLDRLNQLCGMGDSTRRLYEQTSKALAKLGLAKDDIALFLDYLPARDLIGVAKAVSANPEAAAKAVQSSKGELKTGKAAASADTSKAASAKGKKTSKGAAATATGAARKVAGNIQKAAGTAEKPKSRMKAEGVIKTKYDALVAKTEKVKGEAKLAVLNAQISVLAWVLGIATDK